MVSVLLNVTYQEVQDKFTRLDASGYHSRGLGKYIEVLVKGNSALGTRHRRHTK